MKLCTLMLGDMASVKSISEGLLLNGYISEVASIPKQYPESGVTYFTLTIRTADDRED